MEKLDKNTNSQAENCKCCGAEYELRELFQIKHGSYEIQLCENCVNLNSDAGEFFKNTMEILKRGKIG